MIPWEEEGKTYLALDTGIPAKGAGAKSLASWNKEAIYLITKHQIERVEFTFMREKSGRFWLIAPDFNEGQEAEILTQHPVSERIVYWETLGNKLRTALMSIKGLPQIYDPRGAFKYKEGLALLSDGLLDTLAMHSPFFREDNQWTHPDKRGLEGWAWALSVESLRGILKSDPYEGKNITRNFFELKVPDPRKYLPELPKDRAEIIYHGLHDHEAFWPLWEQLEESPLPVLDHPGNRWRSALKNAKRAQEVRHFFRKHKLRISIYGGGLLLGILLMIFGSGLSEPPANTSPQAAVELYYSGFGELFDGPLKAVWQGDRFANEDIPELQRYFIQNQTQFAANFQSFWINPDQWRTLGEPPLESPYFLYGITDWEAVALDNKTWLVEYEKWDTEAYLDENDELVKTYVGAKIRDELTLEQMDELWFITDIDREREDYPLRRYSAEDLIPVDWTALGFEAPPGLPSDYR